MGGWIWVLTSGRSRWVQAGAVALWLLLVGVTFVTAPASPRAAARIPTSVALTESDELWSSPLQSPTQRLVRRQALRPDAGPQQLRVRYVWDARAFAADAPLPEVVASVGGLELPAQLAGANPDEPWCCSLVWRVPPAPLAAGGTIEIRVWQPRRDARVRFIAQRNSHAALLGPGGSLVLEEGQLLSGVPHAYSGTLRPGFLHVWLEAAE